MRLVTYYTPSHREMCERFVLSRSHGFTDVRFSECQQLCPTGEFKSDGWNECMLDKLRTLLSLPIDGEPTLYVDADVCLRSGLAEWCLSEIADHDFHAIGYSDDVLQWCAGVMLFRSTIRTHAWFRLIADLSPIWNAPDQDCIHALRSQCAERNGGLPVPMWVAPGDQVCNWATVGGRTPWEGEEFDVPQSCVAWHANWTIGVENKWRMLERVEALESRQAASVAE